MPPHAPSALDDFYGSVVLDSGSWVVGVGEVPIRRRRTVPETSLIAQTTSVPTATVKHVLRVHGVPGDAGFHKGHPGSSQPAESSSRTPSPPRPPQLAQ